MKKMLEYFEAKEIIYPSQIDSMMFQDHPVFGKSAMKATRKTELKCMCFLSLFVPRGYLATELAMDKAFLPHIRTFEDELDSNPAIQPDDCKIIYNYFRSEFIAGATTYKG